MKLKIKRLDPRAVVPSYAHAGDAGLDLTAISVQYSREEDSYVCDTGISVEIPEGFVGLVFPRSSIVKKDLSLANSVGVIDSGYRGSITFKFRPVMPRKLLYQAGDRVGQLVIVPIPVVEIEEGELSQSERGLGAYGSSGI